MQSGQSAVPPPDTLPEITPDEWRAFAARLCHAAGLGSLGAGLIFFVAANWQAWGLAGRFGVLQASLLVCVAVALWQPPPARVGQAALLFATLFVGALLALFGQSYQTGADVHELFFSWALLALPFALAAQSGAVWAVWWGVLDVGFALLCGESALDRLVWVDPGGWAKSRAAWLMLSCLANLLGAASFFALRRTRFVEAAPLWLTRLLLVAGLGYGTVAVLPFGADAVPGAIALYAAICLGIAVSTWARRQDIFPLTALAGSAIVVSTAWLGHALRWNGLGPFFVLAVWLIASSTAAAALLMRLMRRWRLPDEGAIA